MRMVQGIEEADCREMAGGWEEGFLEAAVGGRKVVVEEWRQVGWRWVREMALELESLENMKNSQQEP